MLETLEIFMIDLWQLEVWIQVCLSQEMYFFTVSVTTIKSILIKAQFTDVHSPVWYALLEGSNMECHSVSVQCTMGRGLPIVFVHCKYCISVNTYKLCSVGTRYAVCKMLYSSFHLHFWRRLHMSSYCPYSRRSATSHSTERKRRRHGKVISSDVTTEVRVNETYRNSHTAYYVASKHSLTYKPLVTKPTSISCFNLTTLPIEHSIWILSN